MLLPDLSLNRDFFLSNKKHQKMTRLSRFQVFPTMLMVILFRFLAVATARDDGYRSLSPLSRKNRVLTPPSRWHSPRPHNAVRLHLSSSIPANPSPQLFSLHNLLQHLHTHSQNSRQRSLQKIHLHLHLRHPSNPSVRSPSIPLSPP